MTLNIIIDGDSVRVIPVKGSSLVARLPQNMLM